jgi:uncharacterized DUF497 family protein
MYTWTEKKNRDNKKKHGLYLSEAVGALQDPHLLEIYDEAHSTVEEERYITIGRLRDTVILFVITTDKNDGDTQIISARKARPKEEEQYNEHYRRETRGN